MTAINTTAKEYFDYHQTLKEHDKLLLLELERRARAFFLEFDVFLRHWERYVKHHERKDEYAKLLRELTHDAYDNSNSYAMACTLRNYAAHAGELVQASFIGEGHFEAGCYSDYLLEDTALKKKDKELIRRQPAKIIPISTIVRESLNELKKIHKELMLFQIDSKAVEASTFVISAYNRIDKDLLDKTWAIVNSERFAVISDMAIPGHEEVIGEGQKYNDVNWNLLIYIAENILQYTDQTNGNIR